MSQRVTTEKRSGFVYAFKQQILTAWQPVPTLKSTVCIFITLGNQITNPIEMVRHFLCDFWNYSDYSKQQRHRIRKEI